MMNPCLRAQCAASKSRVKFAKLSELRPLSIRSSKISESCARKVRKQASKYSYCSVFETTSRAPSASLERLVEILFGVRKGRSCIE